MKHDIAYLKDICEKFQAGFAPSYIKPYGSGHINDIYAVYDTEECPQCILQRINHLIFTKPPELMNNIVRVTDHIRQKLQENNENDIDRKVMTIINTVDDTSYYRDNDGNYWRMYLFIKNAQTYDSLESLEQLYKAAETFGQFQNLLSELPEPPLFETIKDFHCGHSRLAQFKESLEKDVMNRAKDAKEEIDFLLNNAAIFDVFPKMIEEDKIPTRTTHNDTKINNVMIDDDTQEGICVIDLDTVMPGLSLYDFGDMVRTATSPAEEDEPDLSKVVMLMPRFEKLVEGFVQETGDFLTDTEKQHLVFGSKVIIFEQFLRFLTDHLAGDIYYKIHRANHNLNRGRTQMRLLQSIIAQEGQMNNVIERNINL